jgi:hypothetical protein
MSSSLNIKMGVDIPLMTKKVVATTLMTTMFIDTFFMTNFNMIFLLLNMSTVGR